MRRAASRVLAALLALSGTVLLLDSGAGADAPVDVGWWYKVRQGAIGEIITQRPPNVPEGGFYVAQEAEPAAVAALRYDIGALESGILQLAVADGSTALGAEIVACPTIPSWVPEDPGRWSDRPPAFCDEMSIGGTVDTSGTMVTWTLPATFADGDMLNLMLVPAEGATPFQVAFAPPGEESLSSSLLPDDEETTTTTAPPPFTQPPPAFESPDFFIDSGSSFLPPPASDFSPPPPEPVASSTTVAPRPVEEVAAPRLPVPESRTARIVAVGVLFALAGFLYWLGNQPAPAPRLLGALASARGGAVTAPPAPVRGIGRFARARTTAPERLA